MLRFFPTAYPDECLYSLFVRYHIRCGNNRFKKTIHDLLGYTPQKLSTLALPSNLHFLEQQLSLVAKQTAEILASQYTLYPFYRNFLTHTEIFRLRDFILNKSNRPVSKVTKVRETDRLKNIRSLKYCYHCVQEDLQQYGEAYWHRTHQIPGIWVCLKHQTILHQISLPLKEGYLECHAVALDSCSQPEIVCQNPTRQKLLSIAKNIIWLCNDDHSYKFKGFKLLRNEYQISLRQQGFMNNHSTGKILFYEKKFTEAILAHYGQEFWDIMKPDPMQQTGKYFYRCLLSCDVEPTIDRVMHIILMDFLLKSFKIIF